MKAYTYILKCSDDSFYIGYTTNLNNRLKQHNNGKGAKYTKGRRPVKYVYTKEFNNKNEAMTCEIYLKQLTRAKKIKIINGELLYEKILEKKSLEK